MHQKRYVLMILSYLFWSFRSERIEWNFLARTFSHIEAAVCVRIFNFFLFLFLYLIRILRNFLSHNFDYLHFHVMTESYSIVGKQAANLRKKSIILRTLHLIEIGSVNSEKWYYIPNMSLLNVVELILLKFIIISRVTKCKLDVLWSGYVEVSCYQSNSIPILIKPREFLDRLKGF